MGPVQLYAWEGGDDKKDVLRYPHATTKDIMRQPCVVAETDRLHAALTASERENERLKANREEHLLELARIRTICTGQHSGGIAPGEAIGAVEAYMAERDTVAAANGRKLDEALALVKRAAEESPILGIEVPGCFYCNRRTHAPDCPAAKALAKGGDHAE